MFCPPVSEGGQLQTTVRSKNGCMQSWQGTETTILLAAFESKHRKWSYIFTEDISNDRLALHSRPPNPHWLDQLGVGDDQVLPVDEEDWDFLFAQQIGCSDWPNENLGRAWNSSLENIYNFSYCAFLIERMWLLTQSLLSRSSGKDEDRENSKSFW